MHVVNVAESSVEMPKLDHKSSSSSRINEKEVSPRLDVGSKPSDTPTIFANKNMSQSSMDDCRNETTVQGDAGLNFTQYCNTNIPGHNQGNSAEKKSLQDCIKYCEMTPGCYGATLDGITCQPKAKFDVEQLPSPFVSLENCTAIIVNASQLEQDPAGPSCPWRNLSVQKVKTRDFTILCGADMWGGDVPDEDGNPKAIHTDTMEGCLAACVASRPLCSGVAWDADKQRGHWKNCWLKTSSTRPPEPKRGRLCHSAWAVDDPEPENFNKGCKDNSVDTAEDGRTFRISCHDLRAPKTDSEVTHTESYGQCKARCVSTGSSCVAFSFDAGMQAGYQNCYLFDAMPSAGVRDPNNTFAYLDSISDSFVAPTGELPVESRKELWALVSLVMILIPLLIWRLRKQEKRPTTEKED